MTALLAQALVEYGALNSFARDATLAARRAGDWASDNWLVLTVAGVVLAFVLFRRS